MNAPLPRVAAPAALVHAARYERRVAASLARIWENVLDWEHLPHLHASSFSAIDLEAAGPWGWRARLGLPGAAAAERVELVVDRPALSYCTRTVEGRLPGAEIRVGLKPLGPRLTDVTVDFHLPLPEGVDPAPLGAAYVRVYERLWDEDEEMMRARQDALDAARGPLMPVRLGTPDEVRARAPFHVVFGGRPVAIVLADGVVAAHWAECPHMLGPLSLDPENPGTLVCPWHDYRFPLGGGRELGGRSCRLGPAPRIEAGADGILSLQPAAAPPA